MRIADAGIFIVPGHTGGTGDHWYSRWEAKIPTARRVVQDDWHEANLEAWTQRLVARVLEARALEATRPAVIVAHSLGCMTLVHAAPALAGQVAGAFLVAPPSRRAMLGLAGVDPAFAEIPRAATAVPGRGHCEPRRQLCRLRRKRSPCGVLAG